MKILVTGAAGFIGFHTCKKLCEEGYEITGIDNINDYYDTGLKQNRLELMEGFDNFKFIKTDLTDKVELNNIFEKTIPDVVINLAAQPGVRYSITNPEVSIQSNIISFFNLLECCKEFNVNKLIYASSSSVYGNSAKIPFSVKDNVDHPVSLYAATKKSNELMAYTYFHLYKIPMTGLRFFTVYGSWGRPDMAYFKFADKIMKGETIEIYNNGDMERDFTYIDDVTESISRLLKKTDDTEYRLFNIGGEHPVNLLKFVETLENKLGKKAIKEFRGMQPGDVKITSADTTDLAEYIDYIPEVRIEDGLEKFVNWFKEYYNYK
ncbi:MAG: SDR family NAD(P)-dependent oxidoreductase [Ignavibacteria bacterium]|nr:SDR family NAD(P)-dependent oxidoreductase [Ignavibacteria bacterium]